MSLGNTEGESRLHLDFDITPELVKFIVTEADELYGEKNIKKEKALSAPNLPATYLKIGNYEVTSMREGHLIAKFYFKRRLLIWEILEGPLKKKIEIPWLDISGIMADLNSGILKVELHERPSIEKEKNPEPGKHTLWEESDDFTGNQASTFRIHTLHFPPKTLDQNFETLLRMDNRLFILSTSLFPTELALTFDKNVAPMLPLPPPLDYPDINRIVLGPVGNLYRQNSTRVSDTRGVMNSGFAESQPSWNFNRIPYSQVTTNHRMMTPGLEHNLLNLQSNTMRDTRGVMIPGVENSLPDNIPQYLDTMVDTGGMMMNGGMENIVSNNTLQYLDTMHGTGGMTMNLGLENNVSNIILPQFNTRHNTVRMMMNPGLENGTQNSTAQHINMMPNSRGVMNHRFENNVSNNNVSHFNTMHDTAGRLMMNPEIKIESSPHLSNNAQCFNGTLNTGGVMMDPEMMMEFNNTEYNRMNNHAVEGMLNHGMENQLVVNNSPFVYAEDQVNTQIGESSFSGLSDPDLNALQQQMMDNIPT